MEKRHVGDGKKISGKKKFYWTGIELIKETVTTLSYGIICI
jgi:hypothetical protein